MKNNLMFTFITSDYDRRMTYVGSMFFLRIIFVLVLSDVETKNNEEKLIHKTNTYSN